MRIKEKHTTLNYEGKAELMTIKMPAPVKPEGVDAAVWEKMLSATPTEARHLIREGMQNTNRVIVEIMQGSAACHERLK